ncbi:sugar ABC transporter substrate-binding protein [Pseudomonas sp. Bc-h]|jgi:protein involved in polysaccharide export with SLBB domain|uniref:polysaccharide biosynthesis/export family protein n=1 Tax=unclassified Pseudomonas TaxID=196821 RepID=UPI0009DA506B|nr:MULTISPECIES: polysaccharide biosynthesis/export family protein [unclassified Pseudomonas]MDE1194755.1 polysaccharide export protein [Pseudomonas sp.]OQR31616.1 sugar ABC transporter substrate-binding protein [Pseudomonas sp. Bc-h]
MKNTLLLASVLLLCACNTPARIGLPESPEIQAAQAAGRALAGKPLPPERIHAGDTLRIVRNTGEAPSISAFTANSIYELTLFPVLNDGTFSYPYIGSVKAAGLTVPQLTQVLEDKLAPVYRETALTINISQAPSNMVFVGGAVRNPANLPVAVVTNLEQALVGAGGINADADARLVALLRQGDDGLYKTYFFDYSKLLYAGSGGPTAPVLLQRGDVVFVPKSSVGNKIDGVNLYFNQLIPFSKSLGFGVNYNLRDNN